MEKLIMAGYDPVKQTANFVFISSLGKSIDIRIHKKTFRMLMEDKWNIQEFGDPPTDLLEFKDVIIREVKKDFTIWFETTANELMRLEANGGKK
jgi:hypothetical protein